MILLMISLAVGGGILANKLAPNYTTLDQRSKEVNLGQNLSELRMAISLERLASASPLFYKDWTPLGPNQPNPNFLNYLSELATRGYLRQIPTDPTISTDRWGTTIGKLFWLPTINFVASSGFEVNTLKETSWATGSTNINATITTQWSWPGDTIGNIGSSLVIIKK